MLKLRNVPQLKTFLAALQDPKSAHYHQFLTPAQFTAAYGPSAASVTAVTRYLKKKGLSVTGVSSNRLIVHTAASGAAYEKAFGVQIKDYRWQGRSVYAATRSPQLPVALVGKIQTILGLSNAIQAHPMADPGGPIQLPIDPGHDYCPLGVTYTPQQIAFAYDWPALWNTANGAEVTIAIATTMSANFTASHASPFWSHYGLPPHNVSIEWHTATQSTNDGMLETAADVQWAGAMAPGANIAIYDGEKDLQGWIDTFNEIISDGIAQVVSMSWGFYETQLGVCPNTDPLHPCFLDYQLMQAAAQGITVVVASGDSGSVATYPSTSPYVVSAGGTSLTLKTDGTRDSEVVWNNAGSQICYPNATGGAVSAYFPQPAWQTGVGVPQNGYRNTNDLALNANPLTGYFVWFNGGLKPGHGGTSFVAPQLAGLFAVFISLSNGQDLGQANPAIYADAANHYGSDFYDVTSGNNGAFNAGTGWDHPSGWGSLNANDFLTHLNGGIALSVPYLSPVEFLRCRYGTAHFLVEFHAGDVGVASSYQLQKQQYGSWTTVYQGQVGVINLGVPGGTSVLLRLRGYSGVFWTSWDTQGITAPNCGSGGGGPPDPRFAGTGAA
ncbi:MAG: S53 family peptidase [Nitrococcus sp.]|nr:S53 family peptidase [Nitrococcus sp.]